MKKSVKFRFSESVIDISSVFFAINSENEAILNLDSVSQYSFSKNEFRFVPVGFDIDGCFVVEFTEEGMGEYNRIKREVNQYMGVSGDVTK
jgi:hypothetical protein